MKAVLHYRASPGLLAQIRATTPAGLDVVVVPEDDPARFAAEMADAQVLLHVLSPVTEQVLRGAPRLRLVQKIGVGVDTIDRRVAAELGVRVANMPGRNSQAVAEMTLALMLAVLRRIVYLDRATRAGRGWALPLDALDRAGEIGGRTVGLIGAGAVPARLVPVLDALGAKVLVTSPSMRALPPARTVGLDELLSASDIVSLHLPLNAATAGLIGAGTLAAMKPGSLLINTARGGLVDEAALVQALSSGRLAGAGLDVMRDEPLGAESALAGRTDVVITPHVAWLTPETLARCLAVAYENCERLRTGAPLLNEVPY